MENIQLTEEIIKICYAASKLIKEKKQEIIKIDFIELFSTAELDLSKQVFKTIQKNSFDQLAHLESLIIKTTHFEKFNSESFLSLLKLKNLKIYKYGETRRQFIDIFYKKYLRFRFELKNENVFFKLENLENLIISKNRIKLLNDKFFIGLSNLKILDLSFNHLKVIQPMTFINLVNLEEMNLESNDLQILSNDYFVGLKQLKLLNFENNKIEKIEDNTFSSLEQLKFLNLGSNLIENLDENVFKVLKNLTELDLEDNYIDKLNPIYGLVNLKVLNLERNKLTYESINPKTFDLLYSLKELNLSNNLINRVDDLFTSLKNLNKLRLTFNQLIQINSNCFKNQNELKILDLACNKIKDIKEDSFTKLESLESLELRYNQLTFISSNTFNFSLNGIKEINLSNNLFKNEIKLNGIDPKVVIFNSDSDFLL